MFYSKTHTWGSSPSHFQTVVSSKPCDARADFEQDDSDSYVADVSTQTINVSVFIRQPVCD